MIQAEFEINEFDHSEEKVKLKETGSSWRSTSKGEGETDINCIKNKQTNKQTKLLFTIMKKTQEPWLIKYWNRSSKEVSHRQNLKVMSI